MTTTQPAALPELTQLTGDIQIQDRTIYVLNKNGENAWWATVYPGFHDNGIRVSDDQCRAVAADLARLAALQSQPAAAVVSDEEILTEAARHLGEMHVENCGLDDIKAFARAILALRPQAVPMTEEADPCPGCRKGGVCRTPKCGRLKLPIDHPYRTGIATPAGGEKQA